MKLIINITAKSAKFTDLLSNKRCRVILDYFACLFVPLLSFSLKWRSHHYRWRAANICSAPKTIEQWEFFSVPHLRTVTWNIHNNGHFRGPVPFTPIAERSAEQLSLPVLTKGVSWLRFEHTTFRLFGECSNRLRHRSGNFLIKSTFCI